MAVGAERVLWLCQLDQGPRVSSRQKAAASPSSAPTMTDAGSQTELRREQAVTLVSGWWLCPALSPGWDSSGEHSVGGVPRERSSSA